MFSACHERRRNNRELVFRPHIRLAVAVLHSYAVKYDDPDLVFLVFAFRAVTVVTRPRQV
jgi:hypothetical protein